MGKLDIQYRVLGIMDTNVYFLVNTETNEALIVDPADCAEYITKQFELRGLKMAGILLTHGHFDHIYAAGRLRTRTGVKIYAYEGEKPLLSDAFANRSMIWADAFTIEPDECFENGQTYTIGGLTFKVIATPGHTAGSCCYYFEDEGVLISGDTLFYETYGRTDLETGSESTIRTSLKEILFKLPDDTKVYPGHGTFTTIGHEKEFNAING